MADRLQKNRFSPVDSNVEHVKRFAEKALKSDIFRGWLPDLAFTVAGFNTHRRAMKEAVLDWLASRAREFRIAKNTEEGKTLTEKVRNLLDLKTTTRSVWTQLLKESVAGLSAGSFSLTQSQPQKCCGVSGTVPGIS
ncbi:MAG: hypothetical protein M3O22_03165 [Pseudomonadota bacterium]|nr:hypothetical protein [Pseudomonadota bacterium]